MTARAALPRPDAAPLTDAVLDAQRAVLLEAQRVEHAQVAELQLTIDELTGQKDGDSILEREIAERSRLVALERLGDIDHALERIDEGVYGICERCGRPIALARLEAMPYARRCVDCSEPTARLFG